MPRKAKEVIAGSKRCGGSKNVGGLQQRRHYINKCYCALAVYRNKGAKGEDDLCRFVTANKPRDSRSGYRSALITHQRRAHWTQVTERLINGYLTFKSEDSQI